MAHLLEHNHELEQVTPTINEVFSPLWVQTGLVGALLFSFGAKINDLQLLPTIIKRVTTVIFKAKSATSVTFPYIQRMFMFWKYASHVLTEYSDTIMCLINAIKNLYTLECVAFQVGALVLIEIDTLRLVFKSTNAPYNVHYFDSKKYKPMPHYCALIK